MDKTARLFNCVRCHRQVVICSDCDRGNIYCGSECSQAARLLSVRAAGCRYQNSRKGRLNHAKRQACYRIHKAEETKIVTHHSSQDLVIDDLLSPEPDIEQKRALGCCCNFCKRGPFHYVRFDFLQNLPSESTKYSVWPSGP